MKKVQFLSLLLALVMVLSLQQAVWAEAKPST